MKKIFTTMSAALLVGGFAFNANAAELPQATITSGVVGKYMCTEYGVMDIDLQYKVEGVAQTIKFQNPQSDASGEYVTVKMTCPESEDPTDVKAVLVGDYGIGGFSTRTGEEEGISLSLQLVDLTIDWVSGEYSIEIPADIVGTEDGDTNPVQTITFNSVGEFAYVTDSDINPEPDGIYAPAKLSEVTISFGTNITLNSGDNLDPITYVNSDYDTIELSEALITVNADNIVLDLSSLPVGKYDIELPPGYVAVGENALFAGKTFSYTVFDGLGLGQMILGPAPKGVFASNIELYYGEAISPVDVLPAINIYKDFYWEGAEAYLQISADNVKIVEVPYSEDEQAPSTDQDGTEEPTTISVLFLAINELLAGETGTFIIVIPEGIVENAEGKVNPQQEIEFELVKLSEAEPEMSINEDGIVSVVWEDYYISTNQSEVEAFVVLPNETRVALKVSDIWMGVQGEIEVNDDYNGVEVNLEGLLEEEGDYLVVFPEAFFNISDDDGGQYINNEITYKFTYEGGQTSGVKVVEKVTPSVNGVYNLQGVKVANDANNLPAGLYIINGKKVIVRN